MKCVGWLELKKRMLLSPHLALVAICVFYMIGGALVFQVLEKSNFADLKQHHLMQVDESSERYLETVWQLMRQEGVSKEKAKARARLHFANVADTVFEAYRATKHRYDPDAGQWDFETSLFFTSTMLTSIGYGFIVPFTAPGRLFCIVYCLIGIPLTLVTVANIAKFLSEMIFLLHYTCWTWLVRWKGNTTEERWLLEDAEDEQQFLDRVRLVRFPPILVFAIVVIYGMSGAYLVYKREQWSYTESMYFTFISILTIGFGDFRPKPENLMLLMVVVSVGVIVTTMCMDVLGRMYLKEIHYLGRKLKTTNPFYLIREAKARRRRQAMASLLAQLAKGMIFAHRNYAELGRKKRRQMRRHSNILADKTFMFARQAPDPPTDCQVVSTSAHTVRLAWTASFSPDHDVFYNVRYKLKHNNDKCARELCGIRGTHIEISNVESCSLYEFRITAVSNFGESKPIVLVQYTEPQLSPQHIMAVKLAPNAIQLSWESPFLRAKEVKHYMVYYTENPNARLSEWDKVTVEGKTVIFPDLRYDWHLRILRILLIL